MPTIKIEAEEVTKTNLRGFPLPYVKSDLPIWKVRANNSYMTFF